MMLKIGRFIMLVIGYFIMINFIGTMLNINEPFTTTNSRSPFFHRLARRRALSSRAPVGIAARPGVSRIVLPPNRGSGSSLVVVADWCLG